jgi:hypothetical protein
MSAFESSPSSRSTSSSTGSPWQSQPALRRTDIALHRPVAREDVLEDPGLDVVGARPAVGGRRPLVEGPHRGAGALPDARVEHVVGGPVGEHVLLEPRQVGRAARHRPARRRGVGGGRRVVGHGGPVGRCRPRGRRRRLVVPRDDPHRSAGTAVPPSLVAVTRDPLELRSGPVGRPDRPACRAGAVPPYAPGRRAGRGSGGPLGGDDDVDPAAGSHRPGSLLTGAPRVASSSARWPATSRTTGRGSLLAVSPSGPAGTAPARGRRTRLLPSAGP